MASFPVILLNQPRQYFRLFYRAVVAAYGAACTTVYQHGLLGFIVNDIQWEQLLGNVVLNDDPNLPNQIVPRPTITILPHTGGKCHSSNHQSLGKATCGQRLSHRQLTSTESATYCQCSAR